MFFALLCLSHIYINCLWMFQTTFHFSLQLRDYRAEFSQWWTKEMRSIKLPAHSSVFDYYLDPQTRRFLPWTEKIPSFHMEPDKPLQVIGVISYGTESFWRPRKVVFFFFQRVFF